MRDVKFGAVRKHREQDTEKQGNNMEKKKKHVRNKEAMDKMDRENGTGHNVRGKGKGRVEKSRWDGQRKKWQGDEMRRNEKGHRKPDEKGTNERKDG